MNKITIEHEYNIGDEVYMLYDAGDSYHPNNKIVKCKIISFNSIQFLGENKYCVYYNVSIESRGNRDIKESRLFSSIEDVAYNLYEGE